MGRIEFTNTAEVTFILKYEHTTYECHLLSSSSVSDSRWTQQVILDIRESESILKYQPGDHLAVLPANRSELVQGVIDRVEDIDDPSELVKLMVMKESHTPNGN